MSTGIKFAAPPSEDDTEFVSTHAVDSPTHPVTSGRMTPLRDEEPETDLIDETKRLERFLGAKDRAEDPDTASVYIPSLGIDVIVRELNDREAEDAYGMFQGLSVGSNNRAQRRASGIKDKGLVRISAQVVAIGLVSPDIKNPTIFAKFQQKFGEDLTVTDLLLKLIKPGEILMLNDRILELTGGGEDAVEEAKN